ncbi:MAG TPA: hypothetical protein VJ964_16830 [Balneolaceae bacterium]|nr:hypothetical protein [Balneolaceae bacterium]
MIPFIAMQFTGEIVWTLSDFIVAGILLFGTGLTYILANQKSGNTAYRVAVGLALGTGLFLIWANLAVGLIGSEDNPANLMYFGVIAVGIIGTLASHLRPRGMEYTLLATAFAQGLIVVITIIIGMQQDPVIPVFQILYENGFFIALWIGSALLFRRAYKQLPSS